MKCNLKYWGASLLKGICFLSLTCGCHSDYKKLTEGFRTPPADTKPGLYWYWMNEHVSKEGITRDLEAMASVGIGEAFIGNIYEGGEPGSVKTMSDEWVECMRHAIREGNRLGVDISLFNSPGWSQSGGPWVTPEDAMRFLTYTDTIVDGGISVNVVLGKPGTDFQDVSVLAFPVTGEPKINVKSITTLPTCTNKTALLDNDKSTHAVFKNGPRSEVEMVVEYDEPIMARSLSIYPTGVGFDTECELAVYKEGDYHPVSKVFFDRSNTSLQLGPVPAGKLVMAFKETLGNKFRIRMSNLPANFPLADIKISSVPKIQKVTEKTLSKLPNTSNPSWWAYQWDPQPLSDFSAFPKKEQVVNLTDKCKDGQLEWDVPEGKWRIIRVGMMPTYTTNTPAAPLAKGLEIDKLSKKATRKHFEAYVGRIISGLSEGDRKALKRIIVDSYEVGPQNWSDDYRDSFIRIVGYDPTPYLPVITGAVIGSVEESDRFLWDMRRVVADLIAEQYVGGLQEIAQENGMKLWLENYGHWGYPSEFLKYGSYSNDIGGEFWAGSGPSTECKLASSACNIYGKNDVYAESFTAGGNYFKWHPSTLRKKGDWSYTEGVNNVILHVYIHQPYSDKVPGVNAWFGIEFNRHNTWFAQSKGWIDYQRRSCYLLKQGNPVRDLCFFIGDDAPQMNYWVDPELSKGYSFDLINSDVIINRLQVKDGKLVLPSGMSYSALVLPPLKTMRPNVLDAITKLVEQGAVVIGCAPQYSPSLQGYPQCDEQLRKNVFCLWGDESESVRTVGKGRVYGLVNINEALATENILPDVTGENMGLINWIHREDNGMDIYFVTNQSDLLFDETIEFRVKDRKPELWDAVTGEVRELPSFMSLENTTKVPLKLNPGESIFVVFAKKGKGENTDGALNYPTADKLVNLTNSWDIHFVNEAMKQDFTITANSLLDWTDSEDDRMKYFSGEALYTTKFYYTGEETEKEVYLHFDDIQVMGTVYLNDQEVGTLWTYPYEINVTDYLKKGKNKLRVKVANLWVNQLVNQVSKPVSQREIWTLIDAASPQQPLEPSGIKGDCYLFSYK